MSMNQVAGSERIVTYIERLTAMISQMRSLPPEQQNPILIFLLEALKERDERVLKAAANGDPFIVTWYGNLPEISDSMGIVGYNPISDIFFHLGPTQGADAAELDKVNMDGNVCSLIRYGIYAMTNNLMPRPTAFVAMAEPCDGQLMLHQAWEELGLMKDVPVFQIDPSYGKSDADFKYVAEQLKEIIKFYETTCNRKFDENKLREIVVETNKQYALWDQCNQCMMNSPAPMPSFVMQDAFWYLMQHLLPCGDKRVTAVMEQVLALCQSNVEKGVGPVMDEQIRIFWPDLDPIWDNELGAWLAEEWGAVVVQSFTGLTPYEKIDTSTLDTMLFGLAKRGTLEVPMIRQGRGFVDIFEDDLSKGIRDFNCNAVIFPGHMGHKDQSGIPKFLKQVCRDMGVPFLAMTTDLFDDRYTPMSKVKNDISNFFSACGFKRRNTK